MDTAFWILLSILFPDIIIVDISVIIPTYQPTDYIWQCLDSLNRQSLDHSCYEVIIILNGKKEPYYNQINHYISQNAQTAFRLIYTDISGVSNARNTGMEASNGDFICFLDDDDWVSDNYLEELLKVSTYKGLAISNVRLYIERNACYADSYMTKAFAKNKERKQITILSTRSLCNSACIKIIPKTIIGNSRFNPRFKISEDVLFMATISSNIKEIRLTSPEAIYFRRVRKGSATYTKQTTKSLVLNNLRLIRELIKIFFSQPKKNYNIRFFLLQGMGLFKNIIRIIKGA